MNYSHEIEEQKGVFFPFSEIRQYDSRKRGIFGIVGIDNCSTMIDWPCVTYLTSWPKELAETLGELLLDKECAKMR